MTYKNPFGYAGKNKTDETLKTWAAQLKAMQSSVKADTETLTAAATLAASTLVDHETRIDAAEATIITNTADIATNAADIALRVVRNIDKYQVQDTTTINTTSTSIVNMTSVEQSITVTTGDIIHLVFNGDFSHSTTTDGIIVLLARDTTGLTFEHRIRCFATGTAGGIAAMGVSVVDAPTTGTYTYRARWRTTGGTAYCDTKCLTILHIKKS